MVGGVGSGSAEKPDFADLRSCSHETGESALFHSMTKWGILRHNADTYVRLKPPGVSLHVLSLHVPAQGASGTTPRPPTPPHAGTRCGASRVRRRHHAEASPTTTHAPDVGPARVRLLDLPTVCPRGATAVSDLGASGVGGGDRFFIGRGQVVINDQSPLLLLSPGPYIHTGRASFCHICQ